MSVTKTVGPAVARPEPAALPWLLRVTAVSTLFGAEAIHTAFITEHINEWLPIGLFFFVLSVAEGMLAVALITAPSTWVNRLAITLSLGTVVLWFVSRTLGLPIGPMAGSPEPIGRADAVSTILELITAAVLIFAGARVGTPRAATATTPKTLTATPRTATTATATATATTRSAFPTAMPSTTLGYFLAALVVAAVAGMAIFGATGG